MDTVTELLDRIDKLDATPLTLRQARWKLALALVGCVMFCAVGVWMISFARTDSPNDPWPMILMGAAGIVTFGCFGALGAVGLARPATLTLSARGLEFTSRSKRTFRPWSAVSDFRIVQMRGTKLVMYDDADPPSPRLAHMNQSLTGADSALPSALTIKPEAVLAIVSAAKARWS